MLFVDANLNNIMKIMRCNFLFAALKNQFKTLFTEFIVMYIDQVFLIMSFIVILYYCKLIITSCFVLYIWVI